MSIEIMLFIIWFEVSKNKFAPTLFGCLATGQYFHLSGWIVGPIAFGLAFYTEYSTSAQCSSHETQDLIDKHEKNA